MPPASYILNVSSLSISAWGGTHRLSRNASLEQWEVHRLPPGVEAGFVHEHASQGASEPPVYRPIRPMSSHSTSQTLLHPSEAGDQNNAMQTFCNLRETGHVSRKHAGAFWFSVEAGTFDQVSSTCQRLGGHVASVQTDTQAVVAAQACPQGRSCYLLRPDQEQHGRWVIAADVDAAVGNTTWRLAGNGTQRYPAICKVPTMSGCKQCAALLFRSPAVPPYLPDLHSLWHQRQGPALAVGPHLRMARPDAALIPKLWSPPFSFRPCVCDMDYSGVCVW